MHRHTGSLNRHSCASRNPGRVAICTVIPTPPAVIPAQAGIQAVWSYSPSYRIPQPSFLRKPESRACDHMHRHSGASRNLERVGHIHRHSGASRNPCRVVTYTVIPAPPAVIPAQAGIYACRLHYRHYDAPTTVIPAPAGIYACRLHYRSRRLRRRIPAQPGMTASMTPPPIPC